MRHIATALLGLLVLGAPSLYSQTTVKSSGGALASGDTTWTGEQTFRDNKFVVTDDADTTKKINLQLSGITTGNTRVLTVPDVDITLVGTAATQTLTNKTLGNSNIFTARDDRFTLQDDADATKQVVLQMSGITTGTTRTLTVPDASSTLAVLGLAQNFTEAQTFTKGNAVAANFSANSILSFNNSDSFYYNTDQTPDAMFMGLSVTSRNYIIAEAIDRNTDFAHAQSTNPTLFVHSADEATIADWISISHNQTDGVIDVGGGVIQFADKMDATKHILASGASPTLSSCGTSPSIVGSDVAGKVTVGSGAGVQSCTLTFATAYTTAPACTVSDETEILLVRATSTTTTLILDAAVAGTLASDVLAYVCISGS